MKTLILLLFLQVSAFAQTIQADWQARAVKQFPQLAVKDSPLNKAFLAEVARYKREAPQFFAEKPSWPYIIAVQKAAEQGNAAAQFKLGRMLSGGDDSCPSVEEPGGEKKAIEWYQKAAAGGDARAQRELAVSYDIGSYGFPKDIAKAVEWYQKAAAGGDAIAQDALASCYVAGKGVPKDLKKALEWTRKGAVQGYINCQVDMGLYDSKTFHFEADDIEATAWYYILEKEDRDVIAKANREREARIGRAGMLAAQRRSKEIIKEINTAKAARASTGEN